MKKVTKKDIKKNNEFEMLARLVNNGFQAMDKRFDDVYERFGKIDKRFDGIDERFDGIDERFDGIDGRFDGIDTQLNSINHELRDHSVRLERIERKQSGLLLNLDETIHRSEFKNLSHRVDILEKKTTRK